MLALAAMMLWTKILAGRDLAFAWIAWAVFGQASGAYVGPKTWAVLFLALALAVKARQQPAWHQAPAPAALWQSPYRLRTVGP